MADKKPAKTAKAKATKPTARRTASKAKVSKAKQAPLSEEDSHAAAMGANRRATATETSRHATAMEVSRSARWSMPNIHREGRRFIIIAALVTLFFALADWEVLAWLAAGVTLWVVAFFRDPIRTSPVDPDLLVSPADGLVTQIARVPPPAEVFGQSHPSDGLVTRISIFMSVFDVHINRAPISGTVRKIVYIPGKFLNADLDKASEDNERQHFLIEREDGRSIAFTQIAGLVARRIVPLCSVGESLAIGQRVGLIRFGSRVDVYLPADTAPIILVGQRTVAGETILAYLGHGDAPIVSKVQ